MAFDKRISADQRKKIKSGRRFAKQVGDRQAERHLVAVKQNRERVNA